MLSAVTIPCAAQELSEEIPEEIAGEIRAENGRANTGVTTSEVSIAWRNLQRAREGAPNVVIILLDDVGFGDTSTFGGPIQTPSLSELAATGIRFNNFHTTGICAPTRAALLSGRNAHRMGFGSNGELDYAGYDGIWKKSAASVAEVLRRQGYSTAAFGKWHSTPSWELSPIGPFDRWPTGLGFEYFYGNMIGMSSQWEPTLWRNTSSVLPPRSAADGYQLTGDLVDDAIRWIQTHQSISPGKPYFLYFATGSAHVPHHAPEEAIAAYDGVFDRGWDEVREETFAKQKAEGVIPADALLTERPDEIPAWDSLSGPERQLFARQMEVYAGFLSYTDQQIGRLMRAIRNQESGENTLIIYIVGDNGAEGVIGPAGAEDLVATAVGVNDSVDAQVERVGELGGPLHTNLYGSGWAWAGSTPFKWMKFVASHLGATRNPLVMSWPARIKPDNAIRNQFAHVTDIVPTLYDALDIRAPEVLDGVPQWSLDGMSLVPAFGNAAVAGEHKIQYFESLGNRAIYAEGWMASARSTVPWINPPWNMSPEWVRSDTWELYNLESDFSQSRDVASQYLQKLEDLKSIFDQEARRNLVYPVGVGLGSRLPRPAQDGRHFTYFEGFPGLTMASGLAPNLLASHEITAEIVVPPTGANGVLLAAGGRSSGIALFLYQQRLYWVCNYLNVERTVVSTDPLPFGPSRLRVKFEAANAAQPAQVAIYIDEILAAREDVPRMSPPDPLDNFDIGQDSGEPVSNLYTPPNRFSGSLMSITVSMTE